MLPAIRSSSENYGLAKESSIKDVAIAGISSPISKPPASARRFEPAKPKTPTALAASC